MNELNRILRLEYQILLYQNIQKNQSLLVGALGFEPRIARSFTPPHFLIGAPRFELGLHPPKGRVLPLHHAPIKCGGARSEYVSHYTMPRYNPISSVILILALFLEKSIKTAIMSNCHSVSPETFFSIK